MNNINFHSFIDTTNIRCNQSCAILKTCNNNIVFIVFGIAGTLALKSSFFPLIKPKYISINFALPGGSPSEIEEGVVLKIEDNLEGIAGIERVTSTSRENSGSILIETNTDYEIDAIILEIKNAVDKVSSFPIDLEPVIVSKIEEQEATVIFSLTGNNIDLLSLKTVSYTHLRAHET